MTYGRLIAQMLVELELELASPDYRAVKNVFQQRIDAIRKGSADYSYGPSESKTWLSLVRELQSELRMVKAPPPPQTSPLMHTFWHKAQKARRDALRASNALNKQFASLN